MLHTTNCGTPSRTGKIVARLITYLFILGICSQASAATLTVCAPGGTLTCDYPLVSDAIDAASNDDVIRVFGVITEQGISISGVDVTIESGTAEPAIVQAHPQPLQATARVFSVGATGVATFKNMIIRHGNQTGVNGFGGGILNLGSLVLENMRIEKNFASKSGGGVTNLTINPAPPAVMEIRDSTFSYNEAATSGGAIFNEASEMVVDRTTFFKNQSFEGGAVRNRFTGAIGVIRNSTFAQNEAVNAGAGIYNGAGAEALVLSSTFSGNNIRAIQNNDSGSSFTLQNSILSNSGTDGNGDDCAVFTGAVITDGGHNRVENPGSCTFDALSTVAGNEVSLGQFADYQGPTRTLMPAAGSSALESGDSTESLDQRGVSRPQGFSDDIGAVEVRFEDYDAPKVFEHEVTVAGVARMAEFERVSVLSSDTEIWLQSGATQFDSFTPFLDYFDTYVGVLPSLPRAIASAVRFHSTGDVYWRVIEEDGHEWFFEGNGIQSDAGPVVLSTEWPPLVPRAGGSGFDVYAASVGVDVPFETYDSRYAEDPDQAVAMIAYSLATTNVIYRRQMGIEHHMGRVILRADQAIDPYETATGSNNTSAHKGELENQWSTVLVPSLGVLTDDFYTVICTPCAGLATLGAIPGGSANGLTSAGDFSGFFTHEIGHNWSLPHQTGDSPEGATIMSGNDLLRFSPGNQVLGTLFRDLKMDRLVNLGSAQVPVQPWAGTDRLLFNVNDVDALIDVLANDHDANGESVELVSVEFDSVNPDGGTMNIAPGEGANGRDAVRYSPPASPEPTTVVDRFTYTVRDSAGLESRGYIFVRLVDFSADGTFSQNFDSFVDGTTDIGDGSWAGRYYWDNDNAVENEPQVTNGALELVNSGTGTLSIGAYTLPVQGLDDGFSVSFRMRMTASAQLARGLKINFGDTELYNAFSVYGGDGIPGRFTRGITVALNNTGTTGFSLLSSSTSDEVGYPQEVVVASNDNSGSNFVDGDWHNVVMVWDPSLGVSFKYDGVTIFNQVLDPAFAPTAQDIISIAGQAATGGSAKIEIDDVVLGGKPPFNDDFGNAFTISTVPATIINTLVNASYDADLPALSEPDAWFSIPGQSAASIVRINTCGTRSVFGMDTLISVHSDDGSTGSGANLLGSNDDYANGSDSDACDDSPNGDSLDSAVELAVGPNEPLLVRVSKFLDGNLPDAYFLNVEIEEDLSDLDSDGVPNSLDNCTLISNPDQIDTNQDGIGNRCDPDLNNDCVVNFFDIVQFSPAFATSTGDPDFNADADFDNSGAINFFDYIVLTGAFLEAPGPSATGCNVP